MSRMMSHPLTRKLAAVVGLLMCLLSGPTVERLVLCVGAGGHVAIEGPGSQHGQVALSEGATTVSQDSSHFDIPLLQSGSVAAQQHLWAPPSNNGPLIAVVWPTVPEKSPPCAGVTTANLDPPDPRVAAHQSVVLLI